MAKTWRERINYELENDIHIFHFFPIIFFQLPLIEEIMTFMLLYKKNIQDYTKIRNIRKIMKFVPSWTTVGVEKLGVSSDTHQRNWGEEIGVGPLHSAIHQRLSVTLRIIYIFWTSWFLRIVPQIIVDCFL